MRFGETTFARFISSAAGRMPRIVVKARLPAADVLKTAVYVWESRKAFEAFGASELAR